MTSVSTYLNFKNSTEEAFEFYKSVFNGRYVKELKRFGDLPEINGMPPLSDADKKLVVHVELEILGGHILKGTDALESFGFKVNFGNNMYICLHPDSREQTKAIFNKLAEGGVITQPLEDMYWGAYYGGCTDEFGVQWVVNYEDKKS